MLLKLISKIPLRILYLFADLLYPLAYYVLRYRRDVVMEHLRQAFPDWSEAQRRESAKAYYRQFADVVVEIIKAGSMSEAEIKRRVKYLNLELFDPILVQGQSMIMLSAHAANWEWLLLSAGVNVPMPIDVVYKPLHNKASDRYMNAVRARFGIRPVELQDFSQEVLRSKGSQRGYAILADQRPAGGSKFYMTQFLGRESPFYLGPEKIARFVKIPVFYVRMTRLARGYYQVELIPIGVPPYPKEKDSYAITERYVREMEAHIRLQPESWLWFYRRWRKRMIVVPKTVRGKTPEQS